MFFEKKIPARERNEMKIHRGLEEKEMIKHSSHPVLCRLHPSHITENGDGNITHVYNAIRPPGINRGNVGRKETFQVMGGKKKKVIMYRGGKKKEKGKEQIETLRQKWLIRFSSSSPRRKKKKKEKG